MYMGELFTCEHYANAESLHDVCKNKSAIPQILSSIFFIRENTLKADIQHFIRIFDLVAATASKCIHITTQSGVCFSGIISCVFTQFYCILSLNIHIILNIRNENNRYKRLTIFVLLKNYLKSNCVSIIHPTIDV